MRRVTIFFMCCLLFSIQAQVLPALFHTNWLPNAILTTIVTITLFKGHQTGLISAIIGGGIQDILISNFFGLHIFPYVLIIYALSIVQHRMYEERWYWTCILVAIATVLDGLIRIVMISASGGDISFFAYLWYMVLPTVFWNALIGAVIHNIMKYTQEREDYIW